jgi:hypothetical protein
MSLLNQIERRFGHWGIPGLLRIVAMLQVVVFVILLAKPEFAEVLFLNMGLVQHGQVWRLVTFCLLPPSMALISVVFGTMIMFLVNDALELLWGPFRVNLLFFSTLAMTAVADFFYPGIGVMGSLLVGLLMFMSFATMFPRFILNLFGVLPVPAGLLGLLDLGWLVYLGWTLPVVRGGLVIACVPFLVFALPLWFQALRHGAKVNVRRAEFRAAKGPASSCFHQCSVCGRTDVSHPELGFRVMADDTERCEEHLAG